MALSSPIRHSLLLGPLLLLLALPDTAEAARYRSPLAFTGHVSFTSDYIFRGASRTNGQQTVQADLGLDINLYGNLRLGLWGSGVSSGSAEIRQYISFAVPLPALSLHGGVTRYRFPGSLNSEGDRVALPTAEEISVGVSMSLLSLINFQLTHYEPQSGIANAPGSGGYTELHLRIPLGLWTTYGKRSSGNGSDITVGYSFNFNRLTLGVSYHDNGGGVDANEIDDIWTELRDGNFDSEEVVFNIGARF